MRWIVVVALATALSAPSFAHAGDARGFMSGGSRHPQPSSRFTLPGNKFQHHHHPHTIGQFPRPDMRGGRVGGHNSCFDSSGKSFCDGFKSHPRSHFFVVPNAVFVAPSTSCLVPGYWSYQWVPQTTWYTVWVPGQWSPDGFWVEGHGEQRPWTTYTQQPLWVPERWAC